VNGVSVARDAIVREMQHHAAAKPIAAWQQAARALVIRELLLQEARRLAIAAQPLNDSDGRREADEEAVIRGLIDHEVGVPEPDDDSYRRYYDRNRARFRSPDIYEASHILFAALASDRAMHAKTREDAAAVLAELREHPERFAELARAHSRCPSAAQGGNLGQITAGQTTPEFEQALMAQRPASCARNQWRRVTVFTSSGSTASTMAVRCPMNWSPSVLPIICARACGGGPTRNTSRGWYRRRGSRASNWPAPTRYACIEEQP
jgi:peptidyl-prolyl cis-trans isomerase C